MKNAEGEVEKRDNGYDGKEEKEKLELDRLLAIRMAEVNDLFDEQLELKKRMKCQLGEKCRICYGRGWISVAMVPVYRENKFALHGALKVGVKPTILPCQHADFIASERTRLNAENVSASKIGIEVLKRIEEVEQLQMELYRTTLFGMIRFLIEYVRLSVLGVFGRLKGKQCDKELK